MIKTDNMWLRLIVTLLILVGLLYIPPPAFSQETLAIQNLIRNGSFEEGFQGEFGVGYEWGGFSNGNASVGWSADTWDLVVADGESAQMIEIKNAAELDRYAGIYQTVAVVPDQQYKLSLKGLIRSSEGDAETSDYGYRLQYAVDYQGGTAWELLGAEAWQELPWDEQPLSQSGTEAYRIETFETTITARSDKLTLFIRGWKKWLNNGSGIFDIDGVSLIGPTPQGFEAPSAQLASVQEDQQQLPDQTSEDTTAADVSASNEDGMTLEVAPQNDSAMAAQTEAPLPISGQGHDDSINYLLIIGLALLALLFLSAIAATLQWRRHLIE